MILLILIILIAIPFGIYFKNQIQFNSKQKPFKEKFLSDTSNKLPQFEDTSLPFEHQFEDDGNSMPFLDIKLIHPYNDERIAVMQTGGDKQQNVVFLNENGIFKDITKVTNLGGFENEAAYSIAIGDIDNDGVDEILVGYATGIYMSKYNGTNYNDPVKLFDVPEASIPHDIALSDTNKNGFLDVFVCTFVDRKHFASATYHDLTNKRQNIYMVNNGDGTFTERAKGAGLYLVENSYLAKFVDLNNNGFEDLVLASNTNVGKIYENLGDGTFKEHNLPMDYGFWMGLSVEKLHENADKYHILMSNIGQSFPVAIVRGDLKKEEVFDPHYAFLEQVDGFKFKNVTHQKNLDSNKFGWGVVFADLNNNGRKDAVVTENYIKYPARIHKNFPSKGKVFFQNNDETFAPFQEEIGLLNPHFGYRVIAHDFTGNGYQDVIIGNVNGPIKLFKNKGVK